MKIAFIGSSHLSLNYGLVASTKNYKVTIFDESEKNISNLKKGKFAFYEPNFEKIYNKQKSKISFSDNFNEIKDYKLIFIAEDIDTDHLNKSIYTKIKKLINLVIKNCSVDATIVILSQVEPGFTRNIKWKKKNLFYQVETLIFGDAINRALKPEQFIIGKYNSDCKLCKAYYNFLKKFNVKILEMNYESAELSKICINLYLISSITYANCLNSLSSSLGANWEMIKEVLNNDKRIGPYSYLKPGLGILSGNLMRDLKTTLKISKKNKLSNSYLQFLDKTSDICKRWVQEQILINKFKGLSIFGLTYKENITNLKNSPAIEILKNFKKEKFILFDPLVKDLNLTNKNFKFINNFVKFIKQSKYLIILTPWNEFFKKNKHLIKRNFNGKAIIDPYCMLSKEFKNHKKIKYISL